MLEYLGFHLSFAHRSEAVPSDLLGDAAACGHTHMPGTEYATAIGDRVHTGTP